MAGVSNANLTDLIRTTTENLPNMQFEITPTYQRYEVMDQWLRRDRMEVHSGTQILRDIQLETGSPASYVQLYEKTEINVAETMHQIKVPWRQVQSYWAIERREALRNRKPAAFVNLLGTRRTDAQLHLADILEERAWQAPTSSSDTVYPYGIPYYVVKVSATEGFSGSLPSGHTSVANIDSDTYTNWKNYGADGSTYYPSMNSTCIDTMKKAWLKINFKSPFTVKQMLQGPFRIYVNADTQVAYERLAEAQNQNLGNDLASFNGITNFRRAPVRYIPYLDNDSDDPIYMIDNSKFKAVVQEGDYLREDGPYQDVEQHNVLVTFVDLSFNFICTNRRCQAVIAK